MIILLLWIMPHKLPLRKLAKVFNVVVEQDVKKKEYHELGEENIEASAPKYPGALRMQIGKNKDKEMRI